MTRSKGLALRVVPGIPLIEPGDDLAETIIAGLDRARISPADGDVVVVAQKVVSKAQGRYVDLATIRPSARAIEIGAIVEKDARLVEVILSESLRVLRQARGVLIVEHRLGYVMANAGIDRSNVAPNAGAEPVLLLPDDPDAAAEALRATLAHHFGKALAVVINDSFGRAWRQGTVGVALGAAGLESLRDLRGQPDLYGRRLQVSETAFADEIAAAASLLMGQADEGFPVVLLSGLLPSPRAMPARALVRPAAEDLFR
jgi:coenzyme F420-0:L-glutamate ligase/coenzyme F420-1:gamma-L-glutamate ligase